MPSPTRFTTSHSSPSRGSPSKGSPGKGKQKATPRVVPNIELCECRNHVEGSTFDLGEKLDWPTLEKKIKRVFPRHSNPITPYDWGKELMKHDVSGRTWMVHHLEIRECLPAFSYMKLPAEVAPRVMVRGESATRMSNALESLMNILDEMPDDWKPAMPGQQDLPLRAEHLPPFAVHCSMCGHPRHDSRELHVIPENQTSHQINRSNAVRERYEVPQAQAIQQLHRSNATSGSQGRPSNR